MDTRTFIIESVVAGIVITVAGMLLFSVPPFSNFYVHAMTAGSAVAVARDTPQWWAVFVGSLAYGALVTIALGREPGIVTVLGGFRIGAMTGLLLWCAADFMLLGTTHVGNVQTTLVGPFLQMLPGGVAGGVVAIVQNRVRIFGPAAVTHLRF